MKGNNFNEAVASTVEIAHTIEKHCQQLVAALKLAEQKDMEEGKLVSADMELLVTNLAKAVSKYVSVVKAEIKVLLFSLLLNW